MADAGQTGLAVQQRATQMVGGVWSRLVAMPAGKRNSWLMGAGVLVAAVLGMVWYAGRPDWRVLFSGLEGKDVAQVSQELGAAGIVFEMTPDGTGVEVPAELLDKARMEVAAKGMPQTGRLGFELFDKPNWVGSEFDEKVNYQRALEGELEHTIETIGVVRSARVHLVLAKESLFTSEEKMAKASVVLKLKKSSLPEEQIESIRNLVAGAVENLNPDQVTLVDADGRVNLGAKGHSAVEGDAEQAMETKLVAMLEPLAGMGNVRATVNVSYEEGSEERTDEVYDPKGSVVVTTQKSEQVSGSARTAQGVPGTASNTPAAAPVGAVQGSAVAGTPPLLQGKDALPVYPQNGGANQSMTQESGTYAVTKHLVHTEAGPGRVRRVTAAVVVNDKAVGTGWKPRTTEEMHRLEELARAAVGFDEGRGDAVVMENVSFSGNGVETAAGSKETLVDQAKGLMASQPAALRTGAMVLVALALIMFVLKPVAGQMVATMKEPAGLGAPATRGALGDGVSGGRPGNGLGEAGAGKDLGAPGGKQEVPRLKKSLGGPGVFEQVAEHIMREPAESTRLLEAWIASDGDR